MVPPSPNVQDHEVGVPVDASVKVIVWVVFGELGEYLNAALGAGRITVTELLA